jgi:hypothetical protein
LIGTWVPWGKYINVRVNGWQSFLTPAETRGNFLPCIFYALSPMQYMGKYKQGSHVECRRSVYIRLRPKRYRQLCFYSSLTSCSPKPHFGQTNQLPPSPVARNWLMGVSKVGREMASNLLVLLTRGVWVRFILVALIYLGIPS